MKKKTVAVLFLGHFFIDICMGALPVLYPSFGRKLHLSYEQIGLISAVVMSASVLQLFFGYLADKYRTDWLLPAGVLLTGSLFSFIGFTKNYPLLLAFAFGIGLGSAVYHPRSLMGTSLASPEKLDTAISIWSFGGNIGYAVGPIVAAGLLSVAGLPSFLWMLVPTVLVCLVILAFRNDYSYEPRRGQYRTTARQHVDALPWKKAAAFMASLVVLSYTVNGAIYFMPLFADSLGLKEKTYGALLTMFLVLGSIGGILAARIAERVGKARAITISTACFALFMSAYVLFPKLGVASVAIFAAAGFAALAPFPLLNAAAQELFRNRSGLASGLSLGVSFIVGGFSAVGVGALANLASLRGSLLITSLLSLVCLPLPRIFEPDRRARVIR